MFHGSNDRPRFDGHHGAPSLCRNAGATHEAARDTPLMRENGHALAIASLLMLGVVASCRAPIDPVPSAAAPGAAARSDATGLEEPPPKSMTDRVVDVG